MGGGKGKAQSRAPEEPSSGSAWKPAADATRSSRSAAGGAARTADGSEIVPDYLAGEGVHEVSDCQARDDDDGDANDVG